MFRRVLLVLKVVNFNLNSCFSFCNIFMYKRQPINVSFFLSVPSPSVRIKGKKEVVAQRGGNNYRKILRFMKSYHFLFPLILPTLV